VKDYFEERGDYFIETEDSFFEEIHQGISIEDTFVEITE
jgi:hypothetical protein